MSFSSRETFEGDERFRILRRLGGGGMGVVYEAEDRRSGLRVALKTLRHSQAETLYRFKREFRILADLTHPNLVALYELFATEDGWYFTMEYVEGWTFADALRGRTASPAGPGPADSDLATSSKVNVAAPPAAADAGRRTAPPGAARIAVQCDLARLRRVLPPLAEGIAALHSAGILHRDLKPSNVIVTREQRPVILDFGLLAELNPEQPDRPNPREISGTADYMSPEQASGTTLTEASDWYAVGVMIHAALTGRLPFDGKTVIDRLNAKQLRDGTRPSDHCYDVPEDLDALCGDLLRREPGRRPPGHEILGRLGTSGGRRAVARESAPGTVFVGRTVPLGRLRAAFAASASWSTAVHLRGGSGMGKSALLHRFLDDLRRDGAVVLTGRCYEQESVPYRALDPLTDALGRYLRGLSPDEVEPLLPDDVGVLARTFPTLERVPSIAAAPQPRLSVDPVERRRQAGESLRTLLGRIAAKEKLVIALDDVQWGDTDSAIVLAQLLAGPDPPRLLLVCAARGEGGDVPPFLETLKRADSSCAWTEITLEPLGVQEVVELSVHAGASSRISPEKAEEISRECGGNVFFVHEVLGSEAPVSGEGGVDALIHQRAQDLPVHARRLLEVVAVSARPLRLSLALQSAQLEEEGLVAYAALRNARLVRRAGVADVEELETYHDRVRAAVVSRLDPSTLRAHYAGLATAIEASHPSDREFLGTCLEGSGERAGAGRCFAEAAERAATALAFDRAAGLYVRALRLSEGGADERRPLVTGLAESLANSGRSREAAARFDEAARGATGTALVDLKKRAAYCYSTSGHVDQGRDAFRALLALQGMRLPQTPIGAVASLLGARFRLALRGLAWRERPAEEVPRDLADRADLAWTVAVGLGAMDPLTAAGFSTRAVSLALATGDPQRVVRSLLWESSLAAVDDLPRSAKLIAAAEPVLRKVSTPYLEGLHTLARAIHAMNGTLWSQAAGLFDEAETVWQENCVGVEWELATARHFGYWALDLIGAFPEAGRRVRLRRREAEERGNLYLATSIGVYAEPLVLLAEDRPEEANELRLGSLARWTQKGYLAQHCIAALAGIDYYLYTGRLEEGCRYADEQLRLMRRAQLTRMALVRISAAGPAVSVLLASAMERPDPRERMGAAASIVARMAKERLPWASAIAAGGRAGLASIRGARDEARTSLEEACRWYEVAGMKAHVASARRQIGRIVGGEGGALLVAEGAAVMRGCGIKDVDKTTHRWVPMRIAAP